MPCVTKSTDWSVRDRTVWHQMSGRPAEGAKGPMIVASGDGAWVTDVEGNRYLDGLSGQWCVNVGYGRARLAEAAAKQLERLAFHPLTRGHLPAIELGERLSGLLGGDRATFYANSGSEANELAFKLVRQYHGLRGEPGRFKIIARYRAYHGSTLGALSATGQAMRRTGYEPLAPGFLHVPPPDPYRDGIAEEDLEAYGERCAADLERTIHFELPETVAAVIMEPIITGGGILIPPDSYLPAVKAACERHGVLLICDEVICGFGRTGTWFGHERAGVRPDLVTMAKGITGAYFPLAARSSATRSSPPSRPIRPTRAGCATSTRSAGIPAAARSRWRRSRSWRRRDCSSARRVPAPTSSPASGRSSATTRWSATCAAAGC